MRRAQSFEVSGSRALLFVAVAALGAVVPATYAAVVPHPAVTVRVYDAAGLNSRAMATALDMAASTLASASVDVIWKRCRERDVCQRPLQPGEVALRLVRVAVPRGFKGALPLGDAQVDSTQGTAALGTIYVDRVDWLAAETRQHPASLLGRAIAHELGHLLLASTSHSAHGLMRAIWSRDEIRLGRTADWTFSEADVAAIQARLNGERDRRDNRGRPSK